MPLPVTEHDIPDLAGTSLAEAKDWFAALGHLGLLWHPDDPVDDIVFSRPVTSAAKSKLDAGMCRLHAGRAHWPDPDLLYDLAGVGAFEIERLHPGFVVDMCVPAAGRTGYATLSGQSLPTLVVEEAGTLVAIRFPFTQGTVSEAPAIDLIIVRDGSLDIDGIRLEGATLDETTSCTIDRPMTLPDFEEIVGAFATTPTVNTAPRSGY